MTKTQNSTDSKDCFSIFFLFFIIEFENEPTAGMKNYNEFIAVFNF